MKRRVDDWILRGLPALMVATLLLLAGIAWTSPVRAQFCSENPNAVPAAHGKDGRSLARPKLD